MFRLVFGSAPFSIDPPPVPPNLEYHLEDPADAHLKRLNEQVGFLIETIDLISAENLRIQQQVEALTQQVQALAQENEELRQTDLWWDEEETSSTDE